MECDRFKKLLKSWYLQVQDEALAPARMVSFMKQHVADCRVCLMDPSVRQEVDRITEIVLPPSKVRQTTQPQKKEAEEEPAETVAVEETAVAGDEDSDEDDEDADDEDDDLDEDDLDEDEDEI